MNMSATVGELSAQGAMPKHSGLPKLVIFDCDGVLVQSEEITLGVLVSMLNTRLSAEHSNAAHLEHVDYIERFRGRKIAECLLEIETEFGIELGHEFEQLFREQSLHALTHELKATAGIVDVLEALSIPYCVASSAPRKKIEHCLNVTGLLGYFEGRIFSCYELGRWKPDPLVFLTACSNYAVAPQDALVIEDSVTGIHAAVSANIRVLGFGRPERHLMLADAGALPFSDMRELLMILN